jgi:hypothetical protein
MTWRNQFGDFRPTVLGAAVALVMVAMALCRCGSGSGIAPSSGASDADGGESDATGSDVVVVVGTSSDDASSAKSEDGGADSLVQPDASEAGSPFPCDTTEEPKDEPCLVTETFGVFVSATAGSNGMGTRASPLNSINAGITQAVVQGPIGAPKYVYVCAHAYNETISIGSTRDQVQVFGGFRCTDWSYTGEMPVLAPAEAGVPLTLTSLTSALFADLEIDAPNAPSGAVDADSGAGASSIAVLANGATGVEFRRSTILAGNGQPGAGGVVTPYVFPTALALRGNAADGGAGGASKPYDCPNNQGTTGGAGGDVPSGPGDDGLPFLGAGAGGTSSDCVNLMTGGAGAGGSPGPNGAGALIAGSLTAVAWHPQPGSVGTSGNPGQGGGGGGSTNSGGGGSGGAGGCGGAGGAGGGGGGASIAVFCVNAALTFTDVTLVSAAGGRGGAGSLGQPGEALGGSGGAADPGGGGGCPGGPGGPGGTGGAGGGGAGGMSVGIAYKGTAPSLDAMSTTKFVQGQAGPKGTGGVPGTNDGIAGPTGLQVLLP